MLNFVLIEACLQRSSTSIILQLTRRCGNVYLGVVVLGVSDCIYLGNSASTSVQGVIIGSTEYWDSPVCH